MADGGEGRLQRLGARAFGALLRLLPRDVRGRAGPAMRATFEARQRDALLRGVLPVVWLWAREAAGLVAAAVRARLPSGRGAGRGAPSPHAPGAAPVETFVQDLRHAARSLARSRAFTLTSVAVIALGVGAATAIFSAVDAVILRPLPFRDPGRLVMLWERSATKGWDRVNAAPANALDWREQVDAFQDVALYDSFHDGVTFVGPEGVEQLQYQQVTGNFFDVLGVRPALGTGFTPDDTWDTDGRKVVLSWDTWTSRFGADPSVVGKTVTLGGREVRVTGVMPQGFDFPGGVQLWTPYGWDSSNREQTYFRRAHWVWPIARLKPGVTLEEADAQLQNVASRLQAEYPETNADMGAGMTPLHRFLVGDRRTPLLVLLGAVGLLLLIACANVGNLLLVRAQGRARELAVRRALGAGRARLARLVLLESALLATAGGALGFLVGQWGLAALDGMRSLTLPGVAGLAVDGRVALFSVAVVAACALAFGLPPALRAGRAEPSGALREGGRGGGGRRRWRSTRGLVVGEVALSLALVAAAGLMARSFLRLRSVDPGLRADHVMTFRVGVPSSRYGSRDEVVAFFHRLLEGVEALPGVEDAALVRALPVERPSWSSDFSAEGWPPEKAGREILHREASPGYFRVMGVPLLAGRGFTEADVTDVPFVVVVNQAFVDRWFPGEDVVGKRITFDAVPDSTSRWRTVVGVVGSERQDGLSAPARPEVFAPIYQDWDRSAVVVMRTRGEPAAVMPGVREALKGLDPMIPATELRSMDDVMDAALARDRFLLVLVGLFGGAALLLAAVGVYGVAAQATRSRTREIGIRLALGAEPGDVRAMVLRQGMAPVAVGLIVGLAGALAGARVLRGLLYQVAPTDPATFLAVPLVLAAVALVAVWLPARRATRVDPVGSLREE